MNRSQIAPIVNTDLTDTSAEQLCEIGPAQKTLWAQKTLY